MPKKSIKEIELEPVKVSKSFGGEKETKNMATNKGSFWKNLGQSLSIGMMGMGQGMTGQPYLTNYMNNQQNRAELEFNKWKTQQMMAQGVPVYTFTPDGGVQMVGNVPKGSKVVPPAQMLSPEQKIDIEAKSQAVKEQQMNLGKVRRLYPIIDTIEKEWKKTNPGTRAGGLGKAAMSPLQTDKYVSSYQTFVKGMRAQLARAMGDVGNLSEPEQKAAMELVPMVSDSEAVGIEKLNKVRAFISNLERGNLDGARGLLGQSFTIDGRVYNIPADKVSDFKKAKGIK